MSCRFCGTEQHTIRVVASNATVTYACGTSFFPTDHELGEPFDACWAQSRECKAKAPVTENGKRAMSPTEAESAMRSHLEAEYVDRLQRENATLREALENECKFSAASREARTEMQARIAALERELEQAKEDRARAAMDARNPLLARLTALEAEAEQAREDEAWAHRHAVPILRRGESWGAEHFDGRQIRYAEAPTIAAALRALRAKVEGGTR